MSFDSYIETLFEQAQYNVKNHIEMLCIQAESKIGKGINGTSKKLSVSLIEEYVKRKGYTLNNILKKPVWVKGFTCVYVDEMYVEVWHDRIKNNKSVFISDSLLTGLPITLNYMEKI